MKSKYWDKFYEKPLGKIPWQNIQSDWFKILVDNKTITGSSALDLGCGTGQKSIYLAKHASFPDVTGIDISQRAIEIAKQNAEIEDVRCAFICADATEWNRITTSRTFDFILDWANLHGLPQKRWSPYIEGINLHSHNGTLLLIRAFSSEDKNLEHFDLIRNSASFRHYVFTIEKLMKLFSGFKILMTNKSNLEKSPKEGLFMIEVLLEKL